MSLKDDYYTLSQFSSLVGVTRQTVSRWVKNGRVTGEKIGREVLIPKGESKKFDTKIMDNISKYIIKGIIDGIRKTGHYSMEDRIEPTGYNKKDGSIQFSITRKNGTCDELQARVSRFSADERTLTVEIEETKDKK